MILFPHAKINLGLFVVGKRKDGYHNLETVFYPVPIKDVLEVMKWEEDEWKQTGLPISGKGNLCLDALNAFRRKTGIHEPVYIHLHKKIPMQAGMGGGSSNAAFVLRALNEIFETGLSENELIELAVDLGADCPYFLNDAPKYGTGIGELLSDVEVNLQGYKILLVKPEVSISTKAAFAGITLQEAPSKWKDILKSDPSTWGGVLRNDFEATVFKAHPELQELKETFIQEGAVYSSLTGTGSVVYGIFKADASPSVEVFKPFGDLLNE